MSEGDYWKDQASKFFAELDNKERRTALVGVDYSDVEARAFAYLANFGKTMTITRMITMEEMGTITGRRADIVIIDDVAPMVGDDVMLKECITLYESRYRKPYAGFNQSLEIELEPIPEDLGYGVGEFKQNGRSAAYLKHDGSKNQRKKRHARKGNRR